MTRLTRPIQLQVVGILAIAVVALVTYQPGLKVGFLDGWWYLEWVSTMDLPRYLIQFFDPQNVTQGYRPVQGLYVLLEYAVFGFNPDGYHLAHTLLHAANGVLLFTIVERLSKNWRLAVLSALFYVASPVFALAILWHAVVDPLAAFFYLLTLRFWIFYLETRRSVHWIATFVMYVLALLSKETAFSLALVLFLTDRWFYSNHSELKVLVRRYAAFGLMLFLYLLLVLDVQSHGEFASQWGFKIGPHMLVNLLPYLAVLTFPIFIEKPTEMTLYLWMMIAVLVYALVVIRTRDTAMLFLAIFAGLGIAPLLGFPQEYYNTRYLYTPMMSTSVVMALILESGWHTFNRSRIYNLITVLLVTATIFSGSARVAEVATGLSEYTWALSVPFRDISRQHPAFPDDSYLYFVNSPKTPLADLKGLFLTGYEQKLLVSGTEDITPPNLRSHQNAFVYYFDDADHPREIVVDHNAQTRSSVTLPADFDAPVRLEGIDIVNPTVKPGDPLILILYWRATGARASDYTVFVNLLDAHNRVIVQYEGVPRQRTAPTSQWGIGEPVVDVVVLPIAQVPAGSSYHLEIGSSDPVTMRRWVILDKRRQAIVDKIVIEPIEIR